MSRAVNTRSGALEVNPKTVDGTNSKSSSRPAAKSVRDLTKSLPIALQTSNPPSVGAPLIGNLDFPLHFLPFFSSEEKNRVGKKGKHGKFILSMSKQKDLREMLPLTALGKVKIELVVLREGLALILTVLPTD